MWIKVQTTLCVKRQISFWFPFGEFMIFGHNIWKPRNPSIRLHDSAARRIIIHSDVVHSITVLCQYTQKPVHHVRGAQEFYFDRFQLFIARMILFTPQYTVFIEDRRDRTRIIILPIHYRIVLTATRGHWGEKIIEKKNENKNELKRNRVFSVHNKLF